MILSALSPLLPILGVSFACWAILKLSSFLWRLNKRMGDSKQ